MVWVFRSKASGPQTLASRIRSSRRPAAGGPSHPGRNVVRSCLGVARKLFQTFLESLGASGPGSGTALHLFRSRPLADPEEEGGVVVHDGLMLVRSDPGAV